jgi:TolA-binding protein
MNRQQRRAMAKAGRSKGVSRAMQSVEEAVAQLEGVQKLEPAVREANDALEQTRETLEALSGDLESLRAELRTQREINIRLLTILLGPASQRNLNDWADEDLARVRALEGSLREQYTPQADSDR